MAPGLYEWKNRGVLLTVLMSYPDTLTRWGYITVFGIWIDGEVRFFTINPDDWRRIKL